MTRTTGLGLVVAAVLLVFAAAQADEPYSALRGDTPLTEEGKAPAMAPEHNASLREVRNYPEQPPVIPHETDGYIIDANSNKCLSCHARARTGESQAPMVSITHFMDRDGQFLAAVSPRRYFCTQCHVSQLEVTPPVQNDFVDIDSLLRGSTEQQ